VEKPESEGLPERTRSKWEIDIKMDLRTTEWEVLTWIYLAW
jgi:hypothetical protein